MGRVARANRNVRSVRSVEPLTRPVPTSVSLKWTARQQPRPLPSQGTQPSATGVDDVATEDPPGRARRAVSRNRSSWQLSSAARVGQFLSGRAKDVWPVNGNRERCGFLQKASGSQLRCSGTRSMAAWRVVLFERGVVVLALHNPLCNLAGAPRIGPVRSCPGPGAFDGRGCASQLSR
jgi:hypothetical protein